MERILGENEKEGKETPLEGVSTQPPQVELREVYRHGKRGGLYQKLASLPEALLCERWGSPLSCPLENPPAFFLPSP